MNKKISFFLTSTLLVMGVFVVTNISSAAVGLQVGNSSLNLGAAENLYYGNIGASSATTSNLLLLQTAGVSKLRVDYYGNLTTPATITAGGFTGPLSGIITAANVSAGAFGSNTGGGNYSFPGNVGIGTTNPGAGLTVNKGLAQFFGATLPTSGTGVEIGYDGSASYGLIRSVNRDASGLRNLRISGAGLNFYTGTSAALTETNALSIDTAGNVGIGTNSPNARLSIYENDGTNITLGYYGALGTTYSSWGTVLGNNVKADEGTTSQMVNMMNHPSSGGSAIFLLSGDGMVFHTKSGASTAGSPFSSPRMKITADGDIGIGTTNPQNIFHIMTATADAVPSEAIHLQNPGSGAGTGATIGFYHSAGASGTKNARIRASGMGANLGNLYLEPANGTDFATAMTLLSNGSVGIGTTNPVNRLSIAGANTAPDFASTAVANASLLVSNSDISYGTFFGTLGSGTGLIQQRRQTSATYYNLSINPFGGNVGIGTTAPGAKLDVKGSIWLSGSELIGQGKDYGTPGNSASGYLQLYNGGNGNSILWNTGNYSLVFGVNNAEVMRIKGGNVGIGTTAPNDKLSIGLGGSAAPAGSDSTGHNYTNTYLSTDDYALTNYGLVKTLIAGGSGSSVGYWTMSGTNIYNSNSGNVGIGTTNPTAKLHVNLGVGSASNSVKIDNTSAGGYSSITLRDDRLSDSYGGQFGLYGTTAAGNASNVFFYNYAGGGLDFYAGSGAVPANDLRMRITSVGNVGIGTTGPTSLLHLNGTNANIRVQNSDYNTGQSSITFGHGGSASEKTGIVALANGTWGKSDLYFVLDSDNDSGPFGVATDSKMIIKNSGNVGIGTTNPGAKLDVFGSDANNTLGAGVNGAIRVTNNDVAAFGRLTELQLRHGIYPGSTISSSYTNWGTSAGSDLIFSNNNNTGAMVEYMRIKYNGNVGIGTTAPNDKLSIGLGGSSAPAGSDSTGHNYTNTYLSTDNYALANYGLVKTLVANATSSLANSIGLWGGTKNGNIWNGDAGAGNVGIGTTAPKNKLSIYNPSVASVPVLGASGQTLGVLGDGNNYGLVGGVLGNGNTYLQSQRVDGTATAYSMLLQPNGGNVGIGTTNPLAKLDVVGNIYLSSVNPYGGSSIFNTQKEQNVNNGSVAGAGWYRVAQLGQVRGQNTVTVYTTGGSYAPQSTTIRWWHDWSSAGGLDVISEYGSSYWTQARVTSDSTTNSYLEIYFTQAITNLSLSMQYDGGYVLGSLYGGVLPAGGGTVRMTTATGLFSIGDKMIINSAGNVGIGTTAPGSKLELYGTADQLTGDLTDAGSRLSNLALNTSDSNYGAGASITFGNAQSNAAGSLGMAAIKGFLTNGSGNTTGDLAFSTRKAPADTNLTERMRILASGNVGIGTTAPNDKLSIGSGGNAAPAGSDGTGHNYTQTYLSTDDYALANYGLVKTLIAGGSGSSVGYWTMSGTNIYSSNSGNVGIGTTAPQKKLDVVSNANDFVSVGSAALGIGQWAGIHFGYRENNLSYRKSAIVFERTDNSGGGGNAAGKIHILNGPAVGSGSATLADARLTIGELGNVGINITNPSTRLQIYSNDVPEIASANPLGAFSIKSSASTAIVMGVNPSSPYEGWIQVRHGTVAGANYYPLVLQPIGGNVGIGTTNPLAKLHLSGTADNAMIIDERSWNNKAMIFFREGGSSAYGGYVGYSASPDGLQFNTLENNVEKLGIFIARSTGNVGIGNTNPTYRLDLATYNAENQTDSIRLGASNGPGGGGGTGYGGGLIIQPNYSGYTKKSAGILSTAENNYFRSGLAFFTNPNGDSTTDWSERMRITSGGNVGIGTTGPLDKFSIGMGGVAAPAGSDGTGHNNTQTYVGTDNYALANVGYVKSMMGGSYLPLAGGTMTGDVNFGGRNITNLNGLTVSKITATTIDPLYNIRGINYSTFAPSISGGVKEEYVGKASIRRYNQERGEYEYVVDFDLEKEGSDLWVWRQVVDYSDSSVQVIVTPSGKFAAVYYLVRGNQLVLRSDREVEVSYRLIANRYDWREWPTKAKDQSQTGVIIK